MHPSGKFHNYVVGSSSLASEHIRGMIILSSSIFENVVELWYKVGLILSWCLVFKRPTTPIVLSGKQAAGENMSLMNDIRNIVDWWLSNYEIVVLIFHSRVHQLTASLLLLLSRLVSDAKKQSAGAVCCPICQWHVGNRCYSTSIENWYNQKVSRPKKIASGLSSATTVQEVGNRNSLWLVINGTHVCRAQWIMLII